jgi:hypothetical protein
MTAVHAAPDTPISDAVAPTFMSVRQAAEVSRIADRCGPVSVRERGDGRVVVSLATEFATPASMELALDERGHVVAHRRLNSSTPRAAR